MHSLFSFNKRSDAMTTTERRYYFDRRQHNICFIPGPGFVERRVANRRSDDRFGALLKSIFDSHMEDTVSDEQIQRVVEPVLKKIRESGERQGR